MPLEQNLQENNPKLNIGFFFLSLGLLITLITSVVSLINLIFSTLDKKFPDVLDVSYSYGYNTFDYEGIRVALATLIIFFPIFIVVCYFWKKHTKTEMGHVNEVIKKWLVYIILFLSAIVTAIDLVVLVKYFVSGEITTRFIYKVLATFVIASIIGKYFYISEFWKKEGLIKKINKIINPIAGILIVVFAIVYSFAIMGSPTTQRLLRLDDKRVGDLQSIQYQIINYWQQKEKLPENLELLVNPITDYRLPTPPNFLKGERYEYIIKDEKKLTFEVCAEFSLPMQKDFVGEFSRVGNVPAKDKNAIYPAEGVNSSWSHNAGRTCFSRTIDKDIYPPFSKTLKQ